MNELAKNDLKSVRPFGAAGALLAAFALGVLGCPEAGAWDSYRGMAKEFSNAALRNNADKVAVAPFIFQNNEAAPEGKIIAERLGTELARLGKIELVERDLIERVMKEQYLMATGAVRKGSSSATGNILPVDAIVTGSVFSSEGKLEIHARMIEVQTGRVLHAAKTQIDREWAEPPAVPTFQVAVPKIEVDVPAVFHDALAENSCDQAYTLVTDLERSIVETKAAYWAARMKAPDFSVSKLTHNPGSEILSDELRGRFYELMKSLYYRDSTPQLSQAQLSRISQVEDRINQIISKCNG